MGITEWVAVLVIFAVVYCLIKRYETRLVLIGSGLLLDFMEPRRRPECLRQIDDQRLAGDGHLRLDGLCFRC